jgi:hypothetical protein
MPDEAVAATVSPSSPQSDARMLLQFHGLRHIYADVFVAAATICQERWP